MCGLLPTSRGSRRLPGSRPGPGGGATSPRPGYVTCLRAGWLGARLPAFRGTVAAPGVSFPRLGGSGKNRKRGRTGGGAGAGGERGAFLGPAPDVFQWQGRRLSEGRSLGGVATRPCPRLCPAPSGFRVGPAQLLGTWAPAEGPPPRSDSCRAQAWGWLKVFCPQCPCLPPAYPPGIFSTSFSGILSNLSPITLSVGALGMWSRQG